MIEISGQIGVDLTYDDFRSIMSEQSGDIELMINSPGGVVSDGIGIYNTLMEYEGNIVAYVNGISASIASLIMMAADEVVIYDNSQVMIHKPWTVAAGNSDDFRNLVSVLELLDDDLARIYSERTGKSHDEVMEAMKAETYYNAQSAVDFGLADSVKVVSRKARKEKAQSSETVSGGVTWASVLARASIIASK